MTMMVNIFIFNYHQLLALARHFKLLVLIEAQWLSIYATVFLFSVAGFLECCSCSCTDENAN
jgi:hypothetical protein